MAFSDSQAKKLQTVGQSSYRKSDYKAALSEFSTALSVATTKTLQLSILDNRAATQEKLGAEYYQSALKDARKMISLEKASITGYLRAGKILQLMGKHDVALDIYKYGLKKVHMDDSDGKKLLEGMQQKIISRLEASKTSMGIDPLQIFPFELVDMIFKYLPFEMLMLMQRVSRSWRQFLIAYHPSYVALDFSAARRPVSQFTITTYVKRARGAVRSVVLKKTDHNALHSITRRSNQLSELSIGPTSGLISGSMVRAVTCAANLTILELGCEITTSAVVDFIKRTNKLESLRCQRVLPSDRFDWDGMELRELKTLALSWYSIDGHYPSYIHSNFDIMLQFVPKLVQLELVRPQIGLFSMPPDFSALKYLEVLVFRGSADLWGFPKLPTLVQSLDLSENASLRYRPGLDAIPPDLKSFSISANPRIGNQELLDILNVTSESGSLRYLDIGMCPKIDADSLSWLLGAGHGDNLSFLSLEGSPTFGDQVTKELGRMVHLKRINIGSTQVSGIGIINLMNRKNSKLEWMGLDYCPNIGPDAIDAVRAAGIKVSHRIERLKGGRKVRY